MECTPTFRDSMTRWQIPGPIWRRSPSIEVSSTVSASHVIIHRSGSQTHSFAYNQISIPVNFDSNNGSTETFTIPNNPNLLPPSYYMVFLMSTDRVPRTLNGYKSVAPSAIKSLSMALSRGTRRSGLHPNQKRFYTFHSPPSSNATSPRVDFVATTDLSGEPNIISV